MRIFLPQEGKEKNKNNKIPSHQLQVGLKETNEEELLRFFQLQLERSGHSLENKVEDLLNNKFSVMREVPYIDKDNAVGEILIW